MDASEIKRIAFCYDFDKTLTPSNMQEQGFIQAIGYSPNEFWRKVKELQNFSQTDSIIAYMYQMLKLYNKKHGPLTYQKLNSYGQYVRFYEGVDEWFEKMNAIAINAGVELEHYIISSGNKEIIEGTNIAKFFKKIYASSFFYDESGHAFWPARIVNYTDKTQYIFRISKGFLDESDDRVNEKTQRGDYSISFENMLYIGDSETDVPSMKILHKYGGLPVGVYDPSISSSHAVERLKAEGRIRDFFPADYKEGSSLFSACKDFIKKAASKE